MTKANIRDARIAESRATTRTFPQFEYVPVILATNATMPTATANSHEARLVSLRTLNNFDFMQPHPRESPPAHRLYRLRCGDHNVDSRQAYFISKTTLQTRRLPSRQSISRPVFDIRRSSPRSSPHIRRIAFKRRTLSQCVIVTHRTFASLHRRIFVDTAIVANGHVVRRVRLSVVD